MSSIPSTGILHTGNFAEVARTASAKGGAVDVNKAGQLVVKGEHWHGRAALWLKDHFIPGHRAARNQRVLTALAKTAGKEYATSLNMSPLTVRNSGARSKLQTGNTAQNLLNRLSHLANASRAASQSENAVHSQALAFRREIIAPDARKIARRGTPQRQLLQSAGKNAHEFEQVKNRVSKQFTGFVDELAKNPTFTDGYVPGSKSFAKAYQRGEDGKFTPELLRGCMITVMEQEVAGGKPPHRREKSPTQVSGLNAAQLGWLQARYEEYAAKSG